MAECERLREFTTTQTVARFLTKNSNYFLENLFFDNFDEFDFDDSFLVLASNSLSS